MLSALRIRGVRPIVTVHGADLALEYASSLALMVLVYDATNSPIAAAAMLLAKQVVPGFLAVGLGRWLEPVDPRLGLSVAYLLRALAFLALAAAGPAALYVLAFVAGVAGTTSRVFIRATVARTMTGSTFRAVTAIQNVIFGVMALAGPAAGAWAAAQLDAGPSLRVWAALALALSAVALRFPTTLGDVDEPGDGRESSASTTRAGGERQRVPSAGLIGLAGLLILVFAMDEPALLAYVRDGLGGDVGTYGTILVIWGAGIIVGGVIYAARGVDAPFGAIVLGVSASAVGYVGLGFAPTVPVALVAAFVGGLGNGSYWVAIVTTVLERTPEGDEARVSGRLEGLATAMPALGILLGGILAEVVSARVTLWLPGLIAIAALSVWVVFARAAAVRARAASSRPTSSLPTPTTASGNVASPLGSVAASPPAEAMV